MRNLILGIIAGMILGGTAAHALTFVKFHGPVISDDRRAYLLDCQRGRAG